MGPLMSNATGVPVVYGKVTGTDPRSRPLYRLWLLQGVVVAPKTSEVVGNDQVSGWLDVDRVTLYLPDQEVASAASFDWFPFTTSKGVEAFQGKQFVDTGDLTLFGDVYRAGNAKGFMWVSPFTGQVFGTQLDVVNVKVSGL